MLFIYKQHQCSFSLPYLMQFSLSGKCEAWGYTPSLMRWIIAQSWKLQLQEGPWDHPHEAYWVCKKLYGISQCSEGLMPDRSTLQLLTHTQDLGEACSKLLRLSQEICYFLQKKSHGVSLHYSLSISPYILKAVWEPCVTFIANAHLGLACVTSGTVDYSIEFLFLLSQGEFSI